MGNSLLTFIYILCYYGLKNNKDMPNSKLCDNRTYRNENQNQSQNKMIESAHRKKDNGKKDNSKKDNNKKDDSKRNKVIIDVMEDKKETKTVNKYGENEKYDNSNTNNISGEKDVNNKNVISNKKNINDKREINNKRKVNNKNKNKRKYNGNKENNMDNKGKKINNDKLLNKNNVNDIDKKNKFHMVVEEKVNREGEGRREIKSNIYRKNRMLTRTPILVCSYEFTQLVEVNIEFNRPIVSIHEVKNEIVLDNVYLVVSQLNKYSNKINATLIYEGRLKTYIKYLEPKHIDGDEGEAESKYHIVVTKFSGTDKFNINNIFKTIRINIDRKYEMEQKHVNKHGVLQDTFTNINEVKFSTHKSMMDREETINSIELYNRSNLIIEMKCNISIFKRVLI